MKRQVLITAPTALPVTLDYLKNQLKLNTGTEEDELLTLYAEAATESCQSYTGLQAMKAEYADYYDAWCKRLEFTDRNPVLTVDSVEYMPSGSTTYSTLPTTDYYTDLNTQPAAIVLNEMPALEDHPEAIKITYTCGYSDSDTVTTQQAAVPAALKQAIVLQVGHHYMYRTDYAQKELTPASINLLRPLRISWV